MKNKFYLHFFYNLCTFISMLFILALLLIGILYASSTGNSLTFLQIVQFLTLALSPFILYVGFGCFWVFRKVVINNEGIEIFFFKKCIKKVDWDVILSIEKTSHNRNPALKIELPNEEEIYLDDRKPIRRAIEFYSGKQIG